MKRKFLPKNMHTPETWKNKKKRYEQKTSICDPQTFSENYQIHHKDSMTSELNLNKPIIHARQEQTNFMQGDSTVHAGGIVPEVDWGKPVEYIPHNYISYDHYCPNCQSYY
ncbi:hypothetical protein F8M41_004653 [Gigaspora margarita]|uniref:Uncharacterized protein n=1 Tax=Gigaspora margarita TaxID=4874 RepID=A0A8H3XA44_GIGMA|nr:hypothetical protein F8M41_004653 [Gigaspora margarita]